MLENILPLFYEKEFELKWIINCMALKIFYFLELPGVYPDIRFY